MTLYAERPLPHNIEAEEAVIGSLLIDGECIARVAPLLQPGDFYRERNQLCYDAAAALFQRDQAIDQTTLFDELARTEKLEAAGGMAYLSHLVATTPTSLHSEDYAEIVARTSMMRRLISAGSQIAELGYQDTDDLSRTHVEAQDILMRAIDVGRTDDGLLSGHEAVDRYMQLDASIFEEDYVPPVYTRIDALDYMMTGLMGGNLMVIGGRPGHGKTALAMHIMRNALDDGKKTAYMSLEINDREMITRLIAHDTGINYAKLRAGIYTMQEEDQKMQALGQLSDLPFFLGVRRVHTLADIRTRAVQCRGRMQGLDLLLIDYLQLMDGAPVRARNGYANRVQEVSQITRGLKQLATELHVPIILTSQLNRQVEGRSDHRPNLADLRDSGSIEQDADFVLFVSRPSLYGDVNLDDMPSGIDPGSAAELLLAKNRHNAPGSTWCTFDGASMRFRQFY